MQTWQYNISSLAEIDLPKDLSLFAHGLYRLHLEQHRPLQQKRERKRLQWST